MQVTNQFEILRQTIQEGTKIEASLTAAYEALHSAIEGAAIEGRDEAATKEFESINDKMIGLICKYQFTFQDLQWKYQDTLASILDPAVFLIMDGPPSSETERSAKMPPWRQFLMY